MANQIGPDDLNASDWLRTNWVAGKIAVILIYHEWQPFLK